MPSDEDDDPEAVQLQRGGGGPAGGQEAPLHDWTRKLHRVIVFDTVSERFRGMRGPMKDRCMVVRLVAMDGTLGASSFAEGERADRRRVGAPGLPRRDQLDSHV
jgi:hypothetical protein